MSQTWTSTGARSVKCVSTTGSETFPVPAKASTTVAFSSAVAGNTVTLRGITFTAIANGATRTDDHQFNVGTGGSADTDTGTAFVAALARTVVEHGCTGVNATGTVTVTSDVYGPKGQYAITKVGAPITLGAAALAGGVDPVGIFLDGTQAAVVQAWATTAGQTIATGKWVWAWWNEKSASGLYLPVGAMDDTGPAATRGITLVGPSAGFGSPTIFPAGWLAVLPSGVTVTGGSTITHEMTAFSAAPGAVGVRL